MQQAAQLKKFQSLDAAAQAEGPPAAQAPSQDKDRQRPGLVHSVSIVVELAKEASGGGGMSARAATCGSSFSSRGSTSNEETTASTSATTSGRLAGSSSDEPGDELDLPAVPESGLQETRENDDEDENEEEDEEEEELDCCLSSGLARRVVLVDEADKKFMRNRARSAEPQLFAGLQAHLAAAAAAAQGAEQSARCESAQASSSISSSSWSSTSFGKKSFACENSPPHANKSPPPLAGGKLATATSTRTRHSFACPGPLVHSQLPSGACMRARASCELAESGRLSMRRNTLHHHQQQQQDRHSQAGPQGANSENFPIAGRPRTSAARQVAPPPLPLQEPPQRVSPHDDDDAEQPAHAHGARSRAVSSHEQHELPSGQQPRAASNNFSAFSANHHTQQQQQQRHKLTSTTSSSGATWLAASSTPSGTNREEQTTTTTTKQVAAANSAWHHALPVQHRRQSLQISLLSGLGARIDSSRSLTEEELRGEREFNEQVRSAARSPCELGARLSRVGLPAGTASTRFSLGLQAAGSAAGTQQQPPRCKSTGHDETDERSTIFEKTGGSTSPPGHPAGNHERIFHQNQIHLRQVVASSRNQQRRRVSFGCIDPAQVRTCPASAGPPPGDERPATCRRQVHSSSDTPRGEFGVSASRPGHRASICGPVFGSSPSASWCPPGNSGILKRLDRHELAAGLAKSDTQQQAARRGSSACCSSSSSSSSRQRTGAMAADEASGCATTTGQGQPDEGEDKQPRQQYDSNTTTRTIITSTTTPSARATRERLASVGEPAPGPQQQQRPELQEKDGEPPMPTPLSAGRKHHSKSISVVAPSERDASRVQSIMANAKLRQEEFARLLEEHEQIVNEINRFETKISTSNRQQQQPQPHEQKQETVKQPEGQGQAPDHERAE